MTWRLKAEGWALRRLWAPSQRQIDVTIWAVFIGWHVARLAVFGGVILALLEVL